MRVPSVTEVLHLAGLVDYGDVQREVLERASVRGVETHYWIEVIDNGGEHAAVDPIVVGRLEAYKKFRETEVFARSWGERSMVSARHRFGGTPDVFGKIGRDQLACVIDAKPPGPRPWWPVQAAGYQILLEESEGLGYVEGRLLMLGPGVFKMARATREDRNTFLAALTVAHFRLRHDMARLEG